MEQYLAHFEWDDVTAAINLEKHGILFEDAVLAFFDLDFLSAFDEKHSELEIRYVGMGKHPSGAILVTIYTVIRRDWIDCVLFLRDGQIEWNV